MDIREETFAASNVLAEHVAHAVFDALPERGVVVAILAHDGACWQSSPEALAQLGLDETSLAELRARVDDGVEPAFLRQGDASITMAQLATERVNCGYAIIAVSGSAKQPVIPDTALLEALLGQISLVAGLIERNKLARTQVGGLGITGMAECCLN